MDLDGGMKRKLRACVRACVRVNVCVWMHLQACKCARMPGCAWIRLQSFLYASFFV